jgi:hypothetical protein
MSIPHLILGGGGWPPGFSRPPPDRRAKPPPGGGRTIALIALVSEMKKYLEEGWDPVIKSDVDGENALPLRIDRDNWMSGQCVARSRAACVPSTPPRGPVIAGCDAARAPGPLESMGVRCLSERHARRWRFCKGATDVGSDSWIAGGLDPVARTAAAVPTGPRSGLRAGSITESRRVIRTMDADYEDDDWSELAVPESR